MGTPQNLPLPYSSLVFNIGVRCTAWQTSNYHLAYFALVLLSKQHGTVVVTINHEYLGIVNAGLFLTASPIEN